MQETYCTTCGAPDSVLQTSDNQCCGECGDTEGLIWRDDQTGSSMTLEEIKAAVDNGKTVYVGNPAYRVIKDSKDQYMIKCTINNTYIGLTWKDGVTLNGKEENFYEAETT